MCIKQKKCIWLLDGMGDFFFGLQFETFVVIPSQKFFVVEAWRKPDTCNGLDRDGSIWKA